MKREKAEPLPRPTIPLEVRCRVVLRQLGEMFPDQVIKENRFIPRDPRKRSLAKLLEAKLAELAAVLGVEGKPELDHDPQLSMRKKIRRGGKVVGYVPAANDPEHLFYRWDHRIKTNVRGDHGQFSDVVLRKRERRRVKKAHNLTHKSGTKKAKRSQRFGRPSVSSAKLRTGKRKWASRPLRSGNNMRRKKR